MHVHRARVALIVVAPDEIEQVLAAVYAAGVLHQEFDEVELFHRQLDALAVLEGAAALGVDRDVAALQHRRGLARLHADRGAAQQGAHAGLELQDIEGLGHVIVRAGLEAHQQVGAFAARREHDHGHGRKAADLLAGLQAVLLRHHQIEDDQIVGVFPRHGDGGLAVVAAVHAVSLAFEVEFDALDQQHLVVDDQDLHARPSPSGEFQLHFASANRIITILYHRSFPLTIPHSVKNGRAK